MPGMGVGNLNTMGAGTLGMGIPGLSNVAGVTSVGGNIQTGDALSQAYSGIQQYNGKEEHSAKSLLERCWLGFLFYGRSLNCPKKKKKDTGLVLS